VVASSGVHEPHEDSRAIDAGLNSQEESEDFHPWALHMDPSGTSFNGRQRNRLFIAGEDGTFRDLSVLMGADSSLDGRSMVAADFDSDGDADLFCHNLQAERHQLWRNDFGSGDCSVTIQLRATQGHPEGIGATVIVVTPAGPVAQVIARGSGFAASGSPHLIFGLGAAPSGKVRVLWPGDKTWREHGVLAAGGSYLLTQGEANPQTIPVKAGQLSDPWPPGLRMPIGATVPPIVLENAAGEARTLEGGVARKLHFWSSACAPCVRGLESMDSSAREQLQLVCVDPGLRRLEAVRLVQAWGVEGEILFAPFSPELRKGNLGALLDVGNLPVPSTLVINEAGTLIAVERVLE
jgi:hypothetical protein